MLATHWCISGCHDNLGASGGNTERADLARHFMKIWSIVRWFDVELLVSLIGYIQSNKNERIFINK